MLKLNIKTINPEKFAIPTTEQINEAIYEILSQKNALGEIALDLTFVNEKEISKLNKKYRHKDYPTDVLSFPILEQVPNDSQSPQLLGDIVICYEQAQKNALENNTTVENEILSLIKHSTLHLLGFHHAGD